MARSEVERRQNYFDMLSFGMQHPYVQLTKDCLHNCPSRRPTAEQLVATLEGMRSDIEGPYGPVARADAVRQVVMMKAFIKKEAEMREKVNELAVKDREIQTLQQQVVCLHMIISFLVCMYQYNSLLWYRANNRWNSNRNMLRFSKRFHY